MGFFGILWKEKVAKVLREKADTDDSFWSVTPIDLQNIKSFILLDKISKSFFVQKSEIS